MLGRFGEFSAWVSVMAVHEKCDEKRHAIEERRGTKRGWRFSDRFSKALEVGARFGAGEVPKQGRISQLRSGRERKPGT
jgi:hypothetical protein